MAWMGMEVPRGLMPGLASDAEMQSLSTATGRARGRRWLELMLAHHVGGVRMAEAAIDLVTMAKVRRLATAQAQVQTFEISQYEQLLATEYATPRRDARGTSVAETTLVVVLWHLVTANRKGENMSSMKNYLGNRASKEVHLLPGERNCQIREIKIENRIIFATVQAAVRAGYDPCHWCLPGSRR